MGDLFNLTLLSASQSSKEVTTNAALTSLQTGVRGRLSKSVAGNSNVTLTSAECENAIIELTGALTGNIEVRVVAFSKLYAIFNNTSGAFTVTVKTVSGSGVAVPQGQRVVLYCDGTSVYDFSANRIQGKSFHTTAPTDGQVPTWVNANNRIEWATPAGGGGGGGAPTTAKYVVSESDAGLSAEIVIPAMAGHPDAKPGSAQTEDDDFDAGSLDGKWAWHNQGSATISFTNSHALMNAPAAAGANLKAIVQTAPSPSYTVAAKVALLGKYADYHDGGLIFLENGTGKIATFVLIHNTFSITTGFALAVYTYTSATGSPTNRMIMRFPSMGPVYLKAQDDNTNLVFSYSLDGRNYFQVHSMARATGFTTAADRVGLVVNSENASNNCSLSVDWFRRTA